MTDKFAVIGLGQFGFAVARELAKRGVEVMAIDKNMERIDQIKDDVAYAVALDSTDIKALYSQNIADVDTVLIAIGENTEGLLLTTVHLLEMKIKRIIARAMNPQQRLILTKLGIMEILSPEDHVGVMVAETLLNPNKKAYIYLADKHEVVQLRTPSRIVKKTLKDIGFQENYNLKLITIIRSFDEYIDGHRQAVEHILKNPNSETLIQANDEIVLFGKSHDVAKLIELNK